MTEPFRPAPETEQTAAKGEIVLLKRFDYAPLDPDTAQRVQATAHRIRQRVKETFEILIAVGNDLIAVKQLLPHGRFGPWLHAEFNWTERSARNFMAVAQRLGTKTEIISDLQIDPTAAYLLSGPSVPEEAIAAALQRAKNGERITVSAARAILGSFRGNPERPMRASSSKWPAGKLRGELLEVLESFRRRWNPQRIAALAQQLMDFAESLKEK